MNVFVPSLASRHLPVLYDENSGELDTDSVLHVLNPLSRERKQRRESPSHEYIGGGAHQTTRLVGREEGTGGRLSSQMSVLGRQEGRDRPGLHVRQMKRGVLLIFA